MSIFEQQMVRGRLYAQLLVYQQRVSYAQEGIAAMLALCPRPRVSISFGKQSLVLAHMVWQVAPDTPMHFLAASETWLMDNFGEVIDAFLQRFPVRLHIRQTNDAAIDIDAPVRWLQERQPAIQWVFKTPGDSSWGWNRVVDEGDGELDRLADREEYDGWFWGLAKEESQVRAMTLAKTWDGQPHPTIFRYTDGRYRCCPLANWHVPDLAAYIAEHDLPMLRTYHREGLDARTTARVRRRSVDVGYMGKLRHYDIQAYNILCARFPELRGGT